MIRILLTFAVLLATPALAQDLPECDGFTAPTGGSVAADSCAPAALPDLVAGTVAQCAGDCASPAVDLWFPVENRGQIEATAFHVTLVRVAGSTETPVSGERIDSLASGDSTVVGPVTVDEATWGDSLLLRIDAFDTVDECDESGQELDLGAWPYPDPDTDGDGYTPSECGGLDCDDDDASIHPGAEETAGDGIDQDCDGEDLVADRGDADGDGFVAVGFGGDDCDDTNPDVHPDAEEIEDDGIDQDCDGEDLCPTRYATGGSQCSTGGAPAGWLALGLVALVALRRRRVGTWAAALLLVPLVGCGVPDLSPETCPVETIDADGDGYPAEVDGEVIDCDDDDAEVFPEATEVCDGKDNDCDGAVDEGAADSDQDGTPDCQDEEVCDGLDNDGDGDVDEGFSDADGDGVADCVDVEDCDEVDNDGDGTIDEGCLEVGGDVRGLVGPGLVIENEGTTLPITDNGPFTFRGAGQGAPYDVTVDTQPQGQTCTVTDGSGSVPAGGVDDVQVTCLCDPLSEDYVSGRGMKEHLATNDGNVVLFWDGTLHDEPQIGDTATETDETLRLLCGGFDYPIAVWGESAPVDETATFSGFGPNFDVNEYGEFAYLAEHENWDANEFSEPQPTALYRGTVQHPGEVVIATDDPFLGDTTDPIASIGAHVRILTSGQIAFKATSVDTDATEPFPRYEHLFRFTPGTGVELLIEQGGTWDPTGDDPLTIDMVEWEDQLPFNESGHLVALLDFEEDPPAGSQADSENRSFEALALVRDPGDAVEVVRVSQALGDDEILGIGNAVLSDNDTVYFVAETCASSATDCVRGNFSADTGMGDARVKDRLMKWTSSGGLEIIATGGGRVTDGTAVDGDKFLDGIVTFSLATNEQDHLVWKSDLRDVPTNGFEQWDAVGLYYWDGSSITEIHRYVRPTDDDDNPVRDDYMVLPTYVDLADDGTVVFRTEYRQDANTCTDGDSDTPCVEIREIRCWRPGWASEADCPVSPVIGTAQDPYPSDLTWHRQVTAKGAAAFWDREDDEIVWATCPSDPCPGN